ncbi:MAG: hypothetical protein Q9P44_07395 [Anaerolineae bacterium]|nr:hypothetical protein [Anaerolineae bacterium]
MNNLRQWKLTHTSPFSLYLAADQRLSQTDYTDDQVWEVLVGTMDSPALALHTKYGGRVGLASLVPLWTHNGRVIYQAQTYHQAPIIAAFAPAYIATEAKLLPTLALKAEHIALHSKVIGGMYTLTNSGDKAIKIRCDLFGHVGVRGKEEKLAIITMARGGHALAMGTLPNLAPVVMMENGEASQISSKSASPKIGVDITIPADDTLRLRFVHAGYTEIRQSLIHARRWLEADWQPFLDSINAAEVAIPMVQTGDLDWDLVLASSYNRVVQAVLRPAGIFPRETFVAGRITDYGFSRRGDGSDHPRMWEGQAPDLAYLLTPIIASIDPMAAEGIIRNYVAMQKDDGFIDLKPGAASQKQDLLATPILAQAAWDVYLQTENVEFLEFVFPALQGFFDYWLTQDADKDGFPEWQHERQTRYVAFPKFGRGREWSQGADISTTESPDLLAYLISEANALKQMAAILGDKRAAKKLDTHIKNLSKALDSLWAGDHYAHRDRDTDITTSGMLLIEDGAGDIEHIIKRPLASPNRVIVTITGGVSHTPNVTVTVKGLDIDGNEITETASADQLLWQNRHGIYTTQKVFSRVESLRCEGLARVYRVTAGTMDTTDIDLNALLPLIASIVPKAKAKKLIKLALDKKHFLRPNGITMTDAARSIFDPSNVDGAGGVWFYWQTLMGEALIDADEGRKVADITKASLKFLQDILSQEHDFAQFYNSDIAIGLGEKGHISGIAPLRLLHKLFGIRIIGNRKVWLDKEFAWGRALTIRQHGVYVRRTTKQIKVEFPSGHTVEIDAKLSDHMTVEDPNPAEIVTFNKIELSEQVQESIPAPNLSATTASTGRVIIEVDLED